MSIPRYRIGNDLTVLWAINNRDGSPYDLSQKEVRLFVTHPRDRIEVEAVVETLPGGEVNNVIRWDFSGLDQRVLGKYMLTAEIYTSEDKKLIRKDISEAFALVSRSEMENEEGGEEVMDGGELYLSSKLDIYRFGIPKIRIGSNGHWFIDNVDTGVSAIGGGEGLVNKIYTYKDFGKSYDSASVIDTFNAYAIQTLDKRIKLLEADDYLQIRNMADVLFKDDLQIGQALVWDGTRWTNKEVAIKSENNDQLDKLKKLLEWFEFDEEANMIKAKHGLYSTGAITAKGKSSSAGNGTGGSSSSTLAGLTDVSIASPTDGQVLMYSAGSVKWINFEKKYNLWNLADVSDEVAEDGQVLTWDAASEMWIPKSLSGGGADLTSDNIITALGYTPFDANAFTKTNIKNALDISDWALASSKPSYAFSEVLSKPSTLAGYGISDAITYKIRIDPVKDYRHIGYCYINNSDGTESGWKTTGPAMAIGAYNYALRLQAEMSNTDTPNVYVSLTYAGQAKGWARLITYELLAKSTIDAISYQLRSKSILTYSGDNILVNYGSRSDSDLYIYGKNLRFSADGGYSYPLLILNDGSVQIHGISLKKNASLNALNMSRIEAMLYYADGKLMMHRNADADGVYLNYGGATEPLHIYAGEYYFRVGESREIVMTIAANKSVNLTGNANIAGNVTVEGLMVAKNLPQGKGLSQDPSSSFITTIFDADAVGDATFRMRLLRSGTTYEGITAPYAPMLALKASDTHGFISIGYDDYGRCHCYIGGGVGDVIKWTGILFHDNMSLIPVNDNTYDLGDTEHQWRVLYANSIKIGDATLTWDSEAGMVKLDKGIYSTGAITAGGKGQSNKYRLDDWSEWQLDSDGNLTDSRLIESSLSAKLGIELHTRLSAIEESVNLGPVTINLNYITNTDTLTKDQADAAGLTENVIANLLAGRYTKVIYGDNVSEVWDYTCFGSSGDMSLFFTQGDGFNVHFGIELRRNNATDNWTVNFYEI